MPKKPVGIDENRSKHILSVANLMRERALLLGMDEFAADDMFALGYLHDMGYGIADEKGHHEIEGAEVLSRNGYRFADAVRYHGEPFPPQHADSNELLLLQWCDMSVKADGSVVSMAERLDDIASRYGAESNVTMRASAMIRRLEASDLVKQGIALEGNRQHGYRISKIDLHMHSSCSDGTDTPSGLVKKAEQLGMDIIAICDHDTIAGTEEAVAAAKGSPVILIPGIEISSADIHGKYHILGLGYNPSSPAIIAVSDKMHELRKKKAEARIRYLKEEHGIEFSDKVLSEWAKLSAVGRPHMARELVKMGVCPDIQTACSGILEDAPTVGTRIDAADAISAIHEAGGLAIWAHPLGGVGEKPLMPDEFAIRLGGLVKAGLDGLECYYSEFSQPKQEYLLKQARKNGLLVSSGSDYHGANKTVKMGDVCANAPEMELPGRAATTVLEVLGF